MSLDSEYTCEVVKIVELAKHPAADKLQIARFATSSGITSYVCVVRIGDFREGDLAEYFGVDCLIPPGHEQFRFLFKDENATKPHRVRACRLRGIYSEGILLPLYVQATLGDELSDVYSITQWKPLAERNPGPTEKNTAVRGKAVYLGPDYSVLSLKKCPSAFEPGEFVIATEKLHGANLRCVWKSGWLGSSFYVGSHHSNKTARPQGIWQNVKYYFRKALGLTTRVTTGNHHYGTSVWWDTCERMGIAKKIKNYPNYVFYGELYGPGIQANYDYGLAEPSIAFYDIYDLDKQDWLDGGSVRCVLYNCGLPTPDILYAGKYDDEVIKEIAEGVSCVDGKTQREGTVVSRGIGKRLKAKLVSQGYLLQKDPRD